MSAGDREEQSGSGSDGRTKQQTRSKAEEPEGHKHSEGSSSERREQTDRKPLWLCLSVGQSMINMLKAETALLAVGDN